jgi:hypothetical protein
MYASEDMNNITKSLLLMLPLMALGCGYALSRPRPSKEEYIARYFEYFDETQIAKLDYDYQGAIGGAFTVGKAHFKGPANMGYPRVEEAIKAGKITSKTYDPGKMSEGEANSFQRQWILASGGKSPSWLDFPFNKKMRLIEESSEGSDGHPRYVKQWYIDEERNVVYVYGSWG